MKYIKLGKHYTENVECSSCLYTYIRHYLTEHAVHKALCDCPVFCIKNEYGIISLYQIYDRTTQKCNVYICMAKKKALRGAIVA